MGYSKEVIDYILERMIPEHPLPRGGIKKRCDDVAVVVNEEFTPDELCGKPVEPKNILYVYQKYGTDPAYGARKGQVIYPAKTSKERNTHGVLSANSKQVDCPHCGGAIYLEGSQQPVATPTPAVVPTAAVRTTAPASVPTAFPMNASTNVPTAAPTTIPINWASLSNNYQVPQRVTPVTQSRPQAQPRPRPQSQSQYFPNATTMPLWSDSKVNGQVHDAAGKKEQLQGIWSDNTGDSTLTPEQMGWFLESDVGDGNQQALSTNLFTGQNTGVTDVATQPQPHHKQPRNETISNSQQLSVSPMGLGIAPSQLTQPTYNWPNAGSGRAMEMRSSNAQNIATSVPRVSVLKRPRSPPRSAPVQDTRRNNAVAATHGDYSTIASPTPKRTKTTVDDNSVLAQNMGGSLNTNGLLPGTNADTSIQPMADDNAAFDNAEFDWSFAALDAHQYGAPEAVSTAENSYLPYSDVDDDFFAQFLAEQDNTTTNT